MFWLAAIGLAMTQAPEQTLSRARCRAFGTTLRRACGATFANRRPPRTTDLPQRSVRKIGHRSARGGAPADSPKL